MAYLPTGGAGLPGVNPGGPRRGVVPTAATGKFGKPPVQTDGRTYQPPGAGVLPGTSRNVVTPTGMHLTVTSDAQGHVHFTPAGGTTPAPPASPGAPPTTTPPPVQPDPRDAEYYQNVSDNQFKVNNQINQANLQESDANTALQAALGQLA